VKNGPETKDNTEQPCHDNYRQGAEGDRTGQTSPGSGEPACQLDGQHMDGQTGKNRRQQMVMKDERYGKNTEQITDCYGIQRHGQPFLVSMTDGWRNRKEPRTVAEILSVVKSCLLLNNDMHYIKNIADRSLKYLQYFLTISAEHVTRLRLDFCTHPSFHDRTNLFSH
jgi:hypothetical protein